ncbi:hypothetical protein AU255_03545 [Methyloprofundus sedimenti]|uniref:Uncharacterized protein n=1 Tax=Methyloprofundus sedimenti TaxID=1420851 RepID=A0A1V8M667_9GAMM|nr:hypothetical protein AU255_03545 [Methyloprofundus sedimenti]
MGIRLGCINQAKLTFAALQKTGVNCLGWIASCMERDMLMRDDNIRTLRSVDRCAFAGSIALYGKAGS